MDSFESRMTPRFLAESEKGMLWEPREIESGSETVEGFKEDGKKGASVLSPLSLSWFSVIHVFMSSVHASSSLVRLVTSLRGADFWSCVSTKSWWFTGRRKWAHKILKSPESPWVKQYFREFTWSMSDLVNFLSLWIYCNIFFTSVTSVYSPVRRKSSRQYLSLPSLRWLTKKVCFRHAVQDYFHWPVDILPWLFFTAKICNKIDC